MRLNTPASPLTDINILYIDKPMDELTDRQADSSIPPKTFVLQGYKHVGKRKKCWFAAISPFLTNYLPTKIKL